MRLSFHQITSIDHASCLAIYDSVQADYFIPSDRKGYIRFLNNSLQSETYLLGLLGDEPAACGGFYVNKLQEAFLTWGLVHLRFHGQGLGSELLEYRLHLAQEQGAVRVAIRTSQLTEGFFSRFGFAVLSRRKDGFGAGIDEVVMSRPLSGSFLTAPNL